MQVRLAHGPVSVQWAPPSCRAASALRIHARHACNHAAALLTSRPANRHMQAALLHCTKAHSVPCYTTPVHPPPALLPAFFLQLFEEQRALLDQLAQQLHILPYGASDQVRVPPFSDDRWSWQLPADQLLQPEREMPWEPPAAAAAAPAGEEAQQQQQQQQAGAPPDPRRAPEAAAELAAARAWFGGGRDEQPPAFALPPTAGGSPLSWSQEPQLVEGQPEVTSAAAAAAAAGEERPAGDGECCWGGGRGCALQACIGVLHHPAADAACCNGCNPRCPHLPRPCLSTPSICALPTNHRADDLYAPAAPRHDDAFHRSIGGALSSLGRGLSAGSGLAGAEQPARMEIEEGFWQALHPDLKGQTSVRARVVQGADIHRWMMQGNGGWRCGIVGGSPPALVGRFGRLPCSLCCWPELA